ncbi:conserved exported hypothetical protein [Candidatus Nitrotoga sp. BS]|uniref:hypothetical protein n=1 Tax=Candidatus Nitrotoga sp. BS TaxID=2890408 RepID=UPI001EF33FBE|nr:hypothetical protein [Candidatus Nitrotoga sp. BS]CAH1197928.1 conserved exported hypothetical protein [Candidatus Nitrotoga sp. BS]
MLNLKIIVALLCFLICSPAWAFMPAAGMWGVDSEDNGLPGRGFQIEAENGTVVFTYFGYRADGSSVFYFAAGPIVNNTFTASLLDLRGGTSLGGPHQNASLLDPAGTVTIIFSSGKHGIISLPSEPQRAMSKRPFGYFDGHDGLLGTWLFTRIQGLTPYSQMKNLINNTGKSTDTGNGIVTTAALDFLCEYQISGELAGIVLCGDLAEVVGSSFYVLKYSGDRGEGVAAVQLSSSGDFSADQEMHALRISTKNGIETGLNDGTGESISVKSQLAPAQVSTQNLKRVVTDKPLSLEDVRTVEALKIWASKAQAIVQQVP